MLASLRKMLFDGEARRYLLVGGLCALASNIILIGGDAVSLHYGYSIALVFVTVLPASYLAHACWTFDAELSWTGFGQFILGSLSSFFAAGVLVAALRGGLMLPMIIAAPITTVAMTIYNFVMAKWAVSGGAARPICAPRQN